MSSSSGSSGCLRCLTPARSQPRQHGFSKLVNFEPGHICAIFETMATPAELILCNSPGIRMDRRVTKWCTDHLANITKINSPIGKVRPCVIFNKTSVNNSAEATVCLMGTLNSTPYDELPRVYRHFVIPVSPNPSAAASPHMHSSPEWSHPGQWVIAYPFSSSRRIQEQWPPAKPSSKRLPHSKSRPPYRFDEESMALLWADSVVKLEEWSKLCVDDGLFAVKCAIEYRNSRFASSRSSVASWSTFKSTGTGRCSVSSKRTGIPLKTLSEEVNISQPPTDREGRMRR